MAFGGVLPFPKKQGGKLVEWCHGIHTKTVIT